MNNLKEYIIEKFKIHKGMSTTNSILEHNKVIQKIIELCELKYTDNKDYLEAIRTWVEDNEVKNVVPICDKRVLSYKIPKSSLSLLDSFTNNVTLTQSYARRLIEDGEGKEVLGENWKSPKIYYNKQALVFHEYSSSIGNIDRLFLKSYN